MFTRVTARAGQPVNSAALGAPQLCSPAYSGRSAWRGVAARAQEEGHGRSERAEVRRSSAGSVSLRSGVPWSVHEALARLVQQPLRCQCCAEDHKPVTVAAMALICAFVRPLMA